MPSGRRLSLRPECGSSSPVWQQSPSPLQLRVTFAAAARSHSACASAQQDGSLGQIRRGELVNEVQTGLEMLADGTTAREPIRSRFGWHILRLHRRIKGQCLTFDLVRERIADMLEARSWSIEAARYVSRLAAENEVKGVRIEGAV